MTFYKPNTVIHTFGSIPRNFVEIRATDLRQIATWDGFGASILRSAILKRTTARVVCVNGAFAVAKGTGYTLRLIGPISYLGARYIRAKPAKVTKCVREKIPLYFCGWNRRDQSQTVYKRILWS